MEADVTKVTRIIVSNPTVNQRGGGGRGGGLSPRRLGTCERRIWQFLGVLSTPAGAARQAGISNFITCHQGDTGRSAEPPTPPPLPASATPPPAPDITPSLEVMLREETKVPPSGGATACAPTVSTLLLLPVSVHQPMLTR